MVPAEGTGGAVRHEMAAGRKSEDTTLRRWVVTIFASSPRARVREWCNHGASQGGKRGSLRPPPVSRNGQT